MTNEPNNAASPVIKPDAKCRDWSKIIDKIDAIVEWDNDSSAFHQIVPAVY